MCLVLICCSNFKSRWCLQRFQKVSPDCVPLRNGNGNGRKGSIMGSTCKEVGKTIPTNTNANVSSSSSSGFESLGLRFRSPCRNQDTHNTNMSHFDSPQRTESSPSPSPSTSHSPSGGGGDVLSQLQWGHRKRSRVSRAEIRAATEESSSSVQPKHRRISHTLPGPFAAKSSSASMPPPPPPPPPSAFNGRGRKDNPRNLEDLWGSGSESRKRSPSGLERSEKRMPSSGSAKFQKPSGSSTTQASDRLNNHVDSASVQSEQEAGVAPAPGDKVTVEVIEWPRLYIALSRKEKEYDFLAMKGTKLPQRPKKRAKNIDRTLQYCFPGMWLSDLTKSRYEVREKKSVKKQKRRGLKGLESLDSDSE